MIEHQHNTIDYVIYCLEDIIINREKSKFSSDDIIKNLIFLFNSYLESENKILYNLENSEEHINDHKYLIIKLEKILNLKKIEIESIIFLKKWIKNHKSKYDSILIKHLSENLEKDFIKKR